MKSSIHHHPNGAKSYRFPVWEIRWSERDSTGRSVKKTAWKTTKREAETFLADKKRELAAHGAAHASVSQSERAALIRFREWKNATPGAPDLAAVVEAAIAAHGAAQSTILVSEAISQRLEEAERQNLSQVHRYGMKNRLDRFGAEFGERPLCSITVEDLSRWLHSLGVSPKTFKNYTLAISGMYSLAVDRGQVAVSPVSKIRCPKINHTAPSVLKPSQVRALLTVAHPAILPLLVLQAFCGVRRAESVRLTWADLKMDGEEPFVELNSAITKTNRRRMPPIPENALEWLRSCRGVPGASLGISPDVYRRHLENAAKAAGIAWSENLLRHSFGTYRLSLTKNAAQVCEEMGNSVAVVRAHYANTCTPEDARAFFEVRPEGDDEAKVRPILQYKSA